MIAVCRLRYCARTQAYAVRRTREGKTKREIIRCLKRYIAREAYHALTADLADLGQPRSPRPRHAIAITCGAGFIGQHRRRLTP
jgi:transposase